MPAVVSSPPRADYRRLCSWCHCDLGPLAHPSQHHSYGICEQCKCHYFAHLYMAEAEERTATEVLHERAVGA
jgi:hypothetical protein